MDIEQARGHLERIDTRDPMAVACMAQGYALLAIVDTLGILIGELSVLNTNIQNMDLNLSTVIERK